MSYIGEDGTEHNITATGGGIAVVEIAPESPDGTVQWEETVQSKQDYKCSCGAALDDTTESIYNHLYEVGAIN